MRIRRCASCWHRHSSRTRRLRPSSRIRASRSRICRRIGRRASRRASIALVQAGYLDSGVTESVKIRRAEALAKGSVRWVKAKKLLASAIAPSIVRKETRYQLSDRFVSHPAAEALFDRYQPVLLVVSNPGLILSEVPLLRTAARRRIRSVAVDPSWDNFTNKLIPVRRVDRLDRLERPDEGAGDRAAWLPDASRFASPARRSGTAIFTTTSSCRARPSCAGSARIPRRSWSTLTTSPAELYPHFDHVIRVMAAAVESGRWSERAGAGARPSARRHRPLRAVRERRRT